MHAQKATIPNTHQQEIQTTHNYEINKPTNKELQATHNTNNKNNS